MNNIKIKGIIKKLKKLKIRKKYTQNSLSRLINNHCSVIAQIKLDERNIYTKELKQLAYISTISDDKLKLFDYIVDKILLSDKVNKAENQIKFIENSHKSKKENYQFNYKTINLYKEAK
ncbi:MAG: hypothetical protein WC245_01865 [Bacteroidales bacterium]|jgi:transcriptional regulator with XRE-family HTH domain|nr:hypothetical protein [Bacteroidales bacterium]HOB77281.1 hypothetical protein [Bacteroidales bacterium]HPZ61020.1 hypothetical protein [Bacteroidales bacterium]HQD58742.1 hypothetical protein [Bacteroidales bacterium]